MLYKLILDNPRESGKQSALPLSEYFCLTGDLYKLIFGQLPLAWNSWHGIWHMARVAHFGKILAQSTGADPLVVELFALFHDCRRFSDGNDPAHGPRAAKFAQEKKGAWFACQTSQLRLLKTACRYHNGSARMSDKNITILTCLDADRLDVLRAGYHPSPKYLKTPAAQDSAMIDMAVTYFQTTNFDMSGEIVELAD